MSILYSSVGENDFYTMNENIFGSPNVDESHFIDFNKSIQLIESSFKKHDISPRLMCLYYNCMYNKLKSSGKIPQDVLKLYYNKLINTYAIHHKEFDITQHVVDDIEINSILNTIRSIYLTIDHQFINIVGYYFLCIDFNQPEMLNVSIFDFTDTPIDKSIHSRNYFDINTGEWNIKEKRIMTSESFSSFVLNNIKLNSHWLVGKPKSSEKYIKSGQLYKMFMTTFGINYDVLIKKLKSHAVWLDIRDAIQNINNSTVVVQHTDIIDDKLDTIPQKDQQAIPIQTDKDIEINTLKNTIQELSAEKIKLLNEIDDLRSIILNSCV